MPSNPTTKTLPTKTTKPVRPYGKRVVFGLHHVALVEEWSGKTTMTEAQVAALCGISIKTVFRWKGEHPEFAEAIGKAKAIADAAVERGLYERAIGYSHEVEKIFCNKDGEVTRVAYQEKFPPDPASMLFWLKNRQKEVWRESPHGEGSVSVGGASGLPIINITLNTPAGEVAMRPAVDTTRVMELPAPPSAQVVAPKKIRTKKVTARAAKTSG